MFFRCYIYIIYILLELGNEPAGYGVFCLVRLILFMLARIVLGKQLLDALVEDCNEIAMASAMINL